MLSLIKNRPFCFLLCTSVKPYQQYRLYTETIQRLSRLDLKLDKLPDLSREQCEQELQRRNLNLVAEDFSLMLSTVYQYSEQYDFLDFVCNRIAIAEYSDKSFKYS